MACPGGCRCTSVAIPWASLGRIRGHVQANPLGGPWSGGGCPGGLSAPLAAASTGAGRFAAHRHWASQPLPARSRTRPFARTQTPALGGRGRGGCVVADGGPHVTADGGAGSTASTRHQDMPSTPRSAARRARHDAHHAAPAAGDDDSIGVHDHHSIGMQQQRVACRGVVAERRACGARCSVVRGMREAGRSVVAHGLSQRKVQRGHLRSGAGMQAHADACMFSTHQKTKPQPPKKRRSHRQKSSRRRSPPPRPRWGC